MRQPISEKTNLMLSIDADIKRTFLLKYPRLASSVIESFMRDMCNIVDDANDPVEDEITELQKMEERLAADKHKIAIQLKGVQLRKKEISEKNQRIEIDKDIEERKQARLEKQKLQEANDEYYAKTQIEQLSLQIEFKRAQDEAKAANRTLSAREFLEIYYREKDSNKVSP